MLVVELDLLPRFGLRLTRQSLSRGGGDTCWLWLDDAIMAKSNEKIHRYRTNSGQKESACLCGSKRAGLIMGANILPASQAARDSTDAIIMGMYSVVCRVGSRPKILCTPLR